MDYSTTLMVTALAAIVTLVILYSIISSASRSKKILQTSNAQLRVLIEIAKASGVDPEKIRYEILIARQQTITEVRTTSVVEEERKRIFATLNEENKEIISSQPVTQ